MFSEALASTGSGTSTTGVITQLLPLLLIFVVFYFLLIRPQQRKQKQHRLMLQGLQKGDEIVTSGGIVGKITNVKSPEEIEVEIASNVIITVNRSFISQLKKNDSKVVAEKKSA